MNKLIEKLKDARLYLDIVIGVLCVVLLIAGGYAVVQFMENFDYSYSADNFQYSLENENYARMVNMYYQNQSTRQATNANLQEYYHVAQYFEAAVWYKAYEVAGDTVRMQRQQDKMEENEALMGEFSFIKGDIDEKLGLATS